MANEDMGKTLQRPVLSPDGRLLAAISTDQKIHLVDLAEATNGRRAISAIKVPKGARPFLKECHILRWSPETLVLPGEADEILSNTTSECDLGLTWLLLSDGDRLIALSTDLKSPRMMPGAPDSEDNTKSNILADYELGAHFGKLSLAEFVFNHRHALVIFEFGTTAAILSLVKPQREDVPHIKFPDSRSFANAPEAKHFALLRREKGRDRVTVFEMGQSNNITYHSFDTNTSDAQSLTWCPAKDPIIAVCDSAAYGAKVSFFTAQGHALKQLDISSETFTKSIEPPSQPLNIDMESLGITHWKWTRGSKEDNRTLQITVNGQKQVLIRSQTIKSMSTQTITAFTHRDVVDGSQTFVWQETTHLPDTSTPVFIRQTGTFDASDTQSEKPSDSTKQSGHTAQAHIDIISPNANHTIIATRIRTSPQTLFLWKLSEINNGNTQPHTVLIFTHPIKQVLWHPTLANVLIILTTTKTPRLYAWYQEPLAPITGIIPIDGATTTPIPNHSTNYSATWLLGCTRPDDHRCPFMLTSATAYEVGYIASHEGRLVFESIINRSDNMFDGPGAMPDGDDETTSMLFEIDTPSRRPTGKDLLNPDRGQKQKKARFEVEPNPRTDKEGEVFAEAGYAYSRW
ncbi:hypothetical protein PV05_07347 [Exophiala xenobiotica]|uniref:Uncharacterized protein n=1 Tax=Exophiala xenobiotica TaxID=348802 RepID=A0A0D2BRD6_9EURO|nr:uncharacterized protein PV05_07347 [Exophiala xenobiotica]KIW55031.1 hypothetical protein PV05_07347 [Exophiala xenobiotica]